MQITGPDSKEKLNKQKTFLKGIVFLDFNFFQNVLSSVFSKYLLSFSLFLLIFFSSLSFGTISSCVQGLHLALNLEITPGGACGTT